MDVLKVIKELRDRLWEKYGNPLEGYKKTQDDIHNTYYVGKLMEELGHKWISPSKISGDKEDRAYYSESAIHDAFLAGQLLSKADHKKIRTQILNELRSELHEAIDNIYI